MVVVVQNDSGTNFLEQVFEKTTKEDEGFLSLTEIFSDSYDYISIVGGWS